jgi:excisionase family DNA binding protein
VSLETFEQLDKNYYRPDEVARFLRVSVRTVRRWSAKRKIKHMHTPGGGIRIPRSELMRLLATVILNDENLP